MKIYKFQLGTKDYAVGVSFSTHSETMLLQSNDQPRSELHLHAASVVQLASAYMGITGVKSGLREISFSDGQQGPVTRLTLRVYTSNGKEARLVLPPISRRETTDAKTKVADPTEPRNMYNLAVDLLESAIAEYVQGRRQQAVFDFQAEQVRGMTAEYTEDEEEDSEDDGPMTGPSMLDFASARANA